MSERAGQRPLNIVLRLRRIKVGGGFGVGVFFHTSFLCRWCSPCCSGLEGKGGEGLYPWSSGAIRQTVAKWHRDLRAPAPPGRARNSPAEGDAEVGVGERPSMAFIARGGEGAAKTRHRSQQR